jgi:glutamine amidotransferase of anthranilate synthase or aminodeoxychorismate synthase
MKILLIDNNDSFTYNLFHLIRSVCSPDDTIVVCPNDELEVEAAADFDRIILSPGPGTPAEASRLQEIIRTYEKQIPIFGICLGHQVIAETYGAVTCNLTRPVHGVRSAVTFIDRSGLFRGLDERIMAGRYHSWCVSGEKLPGCLEITAIDDEGSIMALSHREYAVHGVQFHPESFMTDHGKSILSNFLNPGQS